MEHTVTIPIEIERRGSSFSVTSVRTRPVFFVEPFFVDTLRAHFGIQVDRGDNRSLVRSLVYNDRSIDVSQVPLADWVEQFRGTRGPRGLIFHTSRCGSTLVTQMLAASRRFHVLSEPHIISQILDPHFSVGAPYSQSILLRTALASLSESAPSGLPTVVKVRSWSTLYARQVVTTLSDVRWLFVHRHGLEVLASVLRDPPGWLRGRHYCSDAFAPFLGLSTDELNAMADEEYAVRMIGAFCRQASTLPQRHGMYVDYEDITTLGRTIGRHFGVLLTADEIDAMSASTLFHAKKPAKDTYFDSDSQSKRDRASRAAVELVSAFVEPYRRRPV